MNSCPRQNLLWALLPVKHHKPTPYFMVTKQNYIHFRFDVFLFLPLHIHNYVENVLKYIIFYVNDFKVMVEEIELTIRKLLENTLFYQITGQIKSKKLMLTDWKSYTTSLYSDITLCNSSLDNSSGAISLSILLTKKSILFLLYLWSIG